MPHTKTPTPAPTLLPHLQGLMDGPPAPYPWVFGPLDARQALLKSLPARVWPVHLCESARVVQPVWLKSYPDDTRPQQSIQARLKWCRRPTAAGAARAARAADAAGAAGAARAATAAAGAAHAAHAAAGAARAAAGAADAFADAARAADAQWRWMYRAFEAARAAPWQLQWNTSTVISLAEYIWGSCDFGMMPILADALQDAGCDNDDMLARLRSPGVFTRADVVIWTPLGLGESPPTEEK